MKDSTIHVALHYFSGTGNTFRVASWIAQSALARGAEVVLVPVSASAETIPPPAPSSGRLLLGILSPTHGFTAPWAAISHAVRMPGVRGADVFVAVTRAGWYVGPLRLPGFEGTAAWLLALVLVSRGGRLIGVRAIDMPSNWTAVHWGMNAAHVETIRRRAQVKAEAFAERMLDRRPQLTGWLVLAGGLLLVPASLGYQLLARRLLGKLFFADERCTSCGACAKCCPVDAVRMEGTSPGRPYWTFRCESCMRCMNLCPERAIQASWLGATALTLGMLAVSEVVTGVALLSGGLAGKLFAAAVPVAAVLIATGVVYRLVWPLGRRHAVAHLQGLTTPTRLYRRYHEPETDLRRI